MNAGLSNLASLKQFILPGSLAAASTQITPDAVILAIGLMVAGMFDNECNRKLAYAAGDTDEFSGDRDHWYLSRYPLVAITSVQMRYFTADSWTDITGQPLTVSNPTGLLHFGYTLGTQPLRVQVTYSGGYWFETLEPTDAGYPSTQPSGSQALPGALQGAFYVQCSEVWNKRDKLGLGISTAPDQFIAVGKLDLSPIVKRALQPYRRFQLL